MKFLNSIYNELNKLKIGDISQPIKVASGFLYVFRRFKKRRTRNQSRSRIKKNYYRLKKIDN